MEFTDVVLSRRSIRSFTKQQVSDEMIHKLLQAAIYAPSAGNCQPWHFFVIKDETIKTRIYKTACNQDFLKEAPVVIVVCLENERIEQRYGERGIQLYNLQSTAAAIENILLCAKDLGLGACWIGDFDTDAMATILGGDGSWQTVAILPVGYAEFEPLTPQRIPVDEVTTVIGEMKPGKEEKEPETMHFEHCIMNGTVFEDVDLGNSSFHNINLYGIKISEANLTNARIQDCNLSGLIIENCYTEGLMINGKRV